MWARMFFVLAVLLTQGCGTGPMVRVVERESSAPAPALNVGVWTDAASGIRHYRGPIAAGAVANGAAYLIGSEILGSVGSEQVHLMVTVHLKDWLFLNSASDAYGEKLQTTLLDRTIERCVRGRDTSLCTLTETVSIKVPRSYLQRNTKGIRLLLAGQYGGYVVNLPGAYVRGFLAAIPEAVTLGR